MSPFFDTINLPLLVHARKVDVLLLVALLCRSVPYSRQADYFRLAVSRERARLAFPRSVGLFARSLFLRRRVQSLARLAFASLALSTAFRVCFAVSHLVALVNVRR